MKSSQARFLLGALILLFALAANGLAKDNFYLYINMDTPTIYPGEPAKLRISANLSTASKKDITKTAYLKLFKIEEEDMDSDFKEVLARKSPVKEITHKIIFPYRKEQWRYYNSAITLPKLNPGYYVVRLKCDDTERSFGFNVTSLGLIVKSDNEKLVMFLQDQKTGEPVKAKIFIIDTEIKKKHEVASDDNGLAQVSFSDVKDYSGEKELKIVAVKDGNMAACYAGKVKKEAELKGYIYTDRPIYRPSQKVYIKAILRFDRDGALEVARGEKVELTVKDPGNNEIHKSELETDQFGNVSTQFTLGEEPKLGNYYVYVKMGDKTETGWFSVEEYRKPEYEVIVKPEKASYVQGESVNIDVEAKYYFGAPVSDTEFSYSVIRSNYYPYYSFYRYEWWDEEDMSYYDHYGEEELSGTGRTDADGKARISFSIKKFGHDVTYSVVVRMVDKSRREVTGSSAFKATRGKFYLSVSADKYFYEPGSKVEISVKAIDYENNPIKTNFILKISRQIYKNEKTVVEEICTEKLFTNDCGACRHYFTPKEPGYYTVDVSAKDNAGNEINAYDYFYVSAGSSSYNWYNFSSLQIMSDKTSYEPGDTAKFLIANPYPDSTVLLTIEGGKIFRQEVIKFNGNSHVYELPVKKEYCPNFFITLTFFHDKHYRYTSSRVVAPDREHFLTLKITSDKAQYKPRDTARFTLTATDYKGAPVSAQITMGIADESVYALAPDHTPNMQKFFYGLRYNCVATNSSYYGLVPGLGDYKKTEESLGRSVAAPAPTEADATEKKSFGKDGGDKIAQPEFVRDYFPDTCYFNPDIITDQSGKADVNVLLPDSLTTWRATARGITVESKVGEDTKKVIVAKNLLVRLITPRFLTERDEVVISGIVHNYLKASKKVRAELTVEGAKLLSDKKQTAEIAPGGSMRFDWKVKAEAAGKAEFTLKGLSDEESDAMKLKIDVLPHGTEKFASGAGVTASNEVVSLFLPDRASLDTASLRIQLSPSIASTMLSALKYLIGYPYGCVEQTMSRFLPSVVVSDTLSGLGITDKEIDRKELARMVEKGLERLYNFHHSDGGWGWWENDESHPYMTAYVVYGLVRAKAAGFTIREDNIKSGIGWLDKHYGSEKDLNTKSYIVFVLSEAGADRHKWAQELYEKRHKLDNYSIAILTMALNKYKMNEQALKMAELLEKNAETTETTAMWKGKTGGHSWTDNQVETSAYALMALVKVKPKSILVNKAVRYLALSRTGNRWYSTKDTAAAVFALSEYIKNTHEMDADYTGTVTLNGREIKQFHFTRKDIGSPGIEIVLAGHNLKQGKNVLAFEKKGEGKLYFTAYLKYYTDEENIKAQDAGFKIKREYFLINPKAKETDKNYLIPLKGSDLTVREQDKVLVRLQITGANNYEYVVVEDTKPAGFEVTDKPQGRYGYWRYWYAQREDRDEKVAFFITYFYPGENVLEYTLRAETPGTFHTMPSKASLMYIPEVGGTSNEVIFTVEPGREAGGTE